MQLGNEQLAGEVITLNSVNYIRTVKSTHRQCTEKQCNKGRIYNTWCTHSGANYRTDMDCDGDTVPDPLCYDINRNWGFFSSADSCSDKWGTLDRYVPNGVFALSHTTDGTQYTCTNVVTRREPCTVQIITIVLRDILSSASFASHVPHHIPLHAIWAYVGKRQGWLYYRQ